MLQDAFVSAARRVERVGRHLATRPAQGLNGRQMVPALRMTRRGWRCRGCGALGEALSRYHQIHTSLGDRIERWEAPLTSFHLWAAAPTPSSRC